MHQKATASNAATAVRRHLTVRQYVDEVVHAAKANVLAANQAAKPLTPTRFEQRPTSPTYPPVLLWQQFVATFVHTMRIGSQWLCAWVVACAKWLPDGSPLSFAPFHAQSAPPMRPPRRHQARYEKRGSVPKQKGDAYEKAVWTALQDVLFHHPTRHEHVGCNSQRQPAGSSANKDIVLNYVDNDGTRCTTGIEVKTNYNGVDWVQSKMRFVDGTWVASTGCKCPYAGERYAEVLNANADKVTLAPLAKTKLTPDEHAEWKAHKKAHPLACKDVWLPLDDDLFAAQAYQSKGCDYVQIKGYGLYHTGEDVCGFGVPPLRLPVKLRFRVKSHGKNKRKTHYSLSNTAAARAVSAPDTRSPYSLDNVAHFPPQLRARA